MYRRETKIGAMKAIPIMLLFLSIAPAYGQLVLCKFDAQTQAGQYTPDQQRNYAARIKSAADSGKSLLTITHSVKLKLWMIYDDNGGGLGPSAPVYQAIENASQNYFEQAGIEFTVCGEQAVNSSFFHNLDWGAELDSLKSTYYQHGVINIYIVGLLGGGSGGVGFFIGYDTDLTAFSYDAASNPNSDIGFAHELGHCMHLFHTHGKYDYSPAFCNPFNNYTGLNDDVWCQGAVVLDNNPSVDDNNDQIPDCMQTGDDICDTHAEPQLGLPGMVTNCIYTGTVTDPYDSLYNPVTGNIMSYTPDIQNCSPFFTPEQYARMVFALDNYGLQLFCFNCAGSPPSTITVTSAANAGVGSLRWAIACANNSANPDTIIFSNTLGASFINLNTPLPLLKSNVTILGGNAAIAKTTISGLGLTDQYANGLTMDGQHIFIKKLIIPDMPYKGVAGWNACNDVLIDSCEITGSGRLQSPYGNGVVFQNSTNIQIKNSRILDSRGNGLELDADNVILENNVIGTSDFNAVLLYGQSYNIQFFGNKIGVDTDGTPLSNLSGGVIIVDGCTDISIGDTSPAAGNIIAHHAFTGIVLAGSSNNCNISGNSMYCNGFGIYVEPGSNNDVVYPEVNNIVSPLQITGTSPVNATVAVYKSNGNCYACEGYQYLGSVIATGTAWTINLPTPLSKGDKITATATVNGNTSQFAWCQEYTCPNNLAVNAIPIPSGTYNADVEITSIGTVAGGSSVIFQAGSSVVLQPGFEVQLGGVLQLVMQGCFP